MASSVPGGAGKRAKVLAYQVRKLAQPPGQWPTSACATSGCAWSLVDGRRRAARDEAALVQPKSKVELYAAIRRDSRAGLSIRGAELDLVQDAEDGGQIFAVVDADSLVDGDQGVGDGPGESTSRSAICRLLRPDAARWAISRCLTVSSGVVRPVSAGVRAPSQRRASVQARVWAACWALISPIRR
ncbi:hypothetical protein EJK15_10025 [Nonomuraea basaltis]|nr:hypothetical protein EJK15_10025 [Nonomuraea basaltis]